jgi:hypothetical protein
MIEELRQVDDSVLASLIDLRRERDALRQRLARMQESASQVSEKVLARVRGDYEARITALDDKAQPLKDAARAAYGRIKPLLDQAQQARETLRLDQEELELRHSLGEYDDAEHGERAARLGESLRVAEDRIAEISGFLAQFVGAFDSPDELAPATTSQVDIPARLATSSAPLSEPRPAPLPPALGAPHEDDGTLMLPPEPPPAPEPPPPASSEPPVWAAPVAWATSTPAPAAPEEPWRAAVAAPADEPAASWPPGQPAAPEEAVEPEAATSGIPAPPLSAPASRARLEALDSDLEPQPHYLEPLTFIGRTPENQIRIYKPAVSRRHAQITETDAGWLLRDLSSENGTYVNGQRITERLLVDGDRVQFGTSRFVLHIAD